MIKLGNKGFFLAETVVVVGIVAAVLVTLYSQISVMYRNYSRNAHYNTVEAIHATYNVKNYISQNYTPALLTSLSSAGTPLLDIKSYDFDTTGYYDTLITNLDIKRIYFSAYNINTLITNYASYNIDAAFLDYLQTLRVQDNKVDTYRIIIILNNGTYSSTYFSPSDLT